MNDAMKQAELELLSTSALVALYNSYAPSDKAVNRFADKVSAVKRTLKVVPDSFWSLTEAIQPKEAENVKSAKAEWPFKEAPAVVFEEAPAVVFEEAPAVVFEEAPAVVVSSIYKQPAKSSALSAAISASWGDEKVAQARKVRDTVLVTGHGHFRSVKAAFEQLGLPLEKHIKFRLALKSKREANFAGFHFKID